MASNMVTATVTIEGTRPLLWHAFNRDAIPLKPRERNGTPGHDPEEWRRTCLVTENGQPYLRSEMIFSCLRDGGKFTKLSRGTLQPLVAATLQVVNSKVLVINRTMPEDPSEDPDEEMYIHVCGVRIPATKSRNIRYRVAASPGWVAVFIITWDRTIVSRNQMEGALIDAGRLCGVGDGRTIGFGRFEVKEVVYAEEEATEGDLESDKGSRVGAR